MDSLISVIIPVYNTGKYIERCLNSILEQTYKNLEVIVVDDGSVDESRSIIERICGLDNRFSYFYQKNAGVSAARNNGIEHANGEFITFLDSDDTIHKEMYSTLIALIDEYDADIAHCSYLRDYGDKKKNIGNSSDIYFFESEDVEKRLLLGNLFSPSVCNKLFKKSVIGDIRFDTNLKINEDLLFDYYTFKKAKRTVYINLCMYSYHIEDTSSCKTIDSVKIAEDCYRVSKVIYEDSIDTSNEEIAYQRMYLRLIGLYRAYIFSDSSSRNAIQETRLQIKKRFGSVNLSKRSRIDALLIIHFPFIYKPIYIIYNRIRKPNWDLAKGVVL